MNVQGTSKKKKKKGRELSDVAALDDEEWPADRTTDSKKSK